MSITREELDRFHKFAAERLDRSSADSTLEELVNQWEMSREYNETVDDIQQGVDDYAAGKSKPLTKAFDQARRDLGLTE